MTLTLTYKSAFGCDRYYPSCKDSQIICQLGGFKSFTPYQVETMKHEGWTLDIKAHLPGGTIPPMLTLTPPKEHNMKSADALAYLAWLKEQIEAAKENCKENEEFPNSYGAGYDSGILRGLSEAYEYFAGEAYN